MNLKPSSAIKAALAKKYADLSDDRKNAILATVRATRPEKFDELNAIFTAPVKDGGLSKHELEFYHDIVDLDAAPPTEGVSIAQSEAVQAKPVTPRVNGSTE